MRTQRTLRGGFKLPLASVLAATMLVPTGCKQVEDIANKVKGEETKEEPKAEPKKEETPKKEPEKPAEPEAPAPVIVADPKVDPTPIKEEEIEALPVEELHTGLDLMLKLVPNDKAEFMIARDPTVVADYIEEGMRFVDGPITKLGSLKGGPSGLADGLGDLFEAYEETSKFHDKIGPALESSGLAAKEGMAMVMDGKAEYIVFNAEDPLALDKFVTAVDETKAGKVSHCKAIDGLEGWNVCAKKEKDLENYKPAEDPAALRASMEAAVPGIVLADANLIVHMSDDGDMINAAVTTIPGSLHMALVLPEKNKEVKEFRDSLVGGEAKTLANVSPGAGFVWAHVSPKILDKAVKEMGGGAPPPVADFVKSMTGDFVFAGSVNPGGMVLQAGVSDSAAFDGVATLAEGFKEAVPKEIPEFGNAKLAFEKMEIGTAKVPALHVGVTDIPEADILKSYTGLHMDAWTFASNNVFTVAVGPNAEGIGKLADTTSTGPSPELLAALPAPLSEGLGAKTVSFAMHLPMDFLHGKQMHDLIKATLKDVPDAKPEEVLALTSLAGAFSSTSMWVDQKDEKLVLHWAVQGIGNRETEEGKVALDAAHAVVDGASPEAEFGPIATKFDASPMAYAYKARAGTEGPGYMIGSGVGAVMASALVAVPVAVGKQNAALADDLGVKPDDPEPVIVEPTVPKQPEIKKTPPKVDPKPKAKPKPKPKADPKKDPRGRPGSRRGGKKDPVVEPGRPLPPKPTKKGGRRRGR